MIAQAIRLQWAWRGLLADLAGLGGEGAHVSEDFGLERKDHVATLGPVDRNEAGVSPGSCLATGDSLPSANLIVPREYITIGGRKFKFLNVFGRLLHFLSFLLPHFVLSP
jgi:hypothetical protein